MPRLRKTAKILIFKAKESAEVAGGIFNFRRFFYAGVTLFLGESGGN